MPRPVLITAGATRNPIDSMRSITSNSSGATGVYILQRLHAKQRTITLMGSNVALLQPGCPTNGIEFASTRDLFAKMNAWVVEHPMGIVVHAAAVGDFEVTNTNASKIASGSPLNLELQPTPKIVDEIKRWSPDVCLVSFKAAAPDTSLESLELIARKQLQRTKSDLVFGNILGNLNKDVMLMSTDGTQVFTNRVDGLDALIDLILQW